VKALPRDALVEKQVLLHTGRVLGPDEDEEGEDASWHNRPAIFESGV
jgi:hypothetical protein